MKKLFVFIVILTIFLTLFGNIIEIKEDGSGDCSTIQLGIDNASNGDTVLVYPGTYFENLLIENKFVTLKSLDSAYRNTIIDGNKISSCIQIRNCSDTVVVDGFTFKNGIGEYSYEGDYSKDGGGIQLCYSNANIMNCSIKNNKVSGGGGGVGLLYSYAYFSNVSINNNYSYVGGGIFAGAGIQGFSQIEFDQNNLCNIYNNYSAYGSDIKMNEETPFTNIYVDTFTVENPNDYYIANVSDIGIPLNNFELSMQNAAFELINHDLYVAPNGNDNNSGLTPEEPLQSISYALNIIKSDSLNPKTIYLADGVYSVNGNNQWLPLHLKGYVSIIGESKENTVLDAENQHRFLFDKSSKLNYQINNIRFINSSSFKNSILISDPQRRKNIVFFNNLDINNSYTEDAIFTISSIDFDGENISFLDNRGSFGLSFYFNTKNNIVLKNCTIKSHQYWDYDDAQRSRPINLVGIADTTGGLPEFTFINTEISDCYDNEWLSDWSSAGIYTSWFLKLNLINCTIVRNWGNAPAAYAVKIHDPNSIVNIYNSIIYRNAPHQIGLFGDPDWGEPIVLNLKNSLIEEGDDEIYDYYENSEINWLGGNLREDPLFVDDDNYDFNLSPESPCINAGTLDFPAGIEMPEFDLAGNPRIVDGKIDMGAYEYQGVSTNENIPKPTNIIKVFPNPSRMDYKNRDYLTTIYGKNIEKGRVIVEIFNIRGQKVKTLMDVFSYPSEFTLNWNGRNQQNKIVSSGQYFCKMVVNDKTYTEKFIILK